MLEASEFVHCKTIEKLPTATILSKLTLYCKIYLQHFATRFTQHIAAVTFWFARLIESTRVLLKGEQLNRGASFFEI